MLEVEEDGGKEGAVDTGWWWGSGEVPPAGAGPPDPLPPLHLISLKL